MRLSCRIKKKLKSNEDTHWRETISVHCDKIFIDKCNLTCHISIHTGEQLYQCIYCDKNFNEKGSLICHIKLHTGEKP